MPLVNHRPGAYYHITLGAEGRWKFKMTKRALLFVISLLLLVVLFLSLLLTNDQLSPVSASNGFNNFIPLILGYEPSLPPATTVPPTATSTSIPTGTATSTTTATATSTSMATTTSMPTASATSMPTATATNMPTVTATSNPGDGGQEFLAFDLNRAVTTADRGFPWDEPPINNFDWTQPVNYAAGTLYYRVEIFGQPQPQNMNLQFCVWQEKDGDPVKLENCSWEVAVYGGSGTVLTWSGTISSMYQKDGIPIEWNRARYRAGIAIKNSSGQPVSDYEEWNWSGEDPSLWYPLNMHFTAVVVAPGAQFSGWDNY